MKQLLLVLLLFAVACKKDANPGNNGTPIQPLTIGNNWTYEAFDYDETGTTMSTRTSNISVAGTQRVNGNTFYRIVDQDGAFAMYLRNIDNNTVEVNIASRTYPYLKRVHSNNTLINSETSQGSCTSTASVYGFSAITKVREHDCLRMEEIHTDCLGKVTTKIITYFKPGIGTIRGDLYRIKNDGSGLYLRGRTDLKSFVLL